VVYLSTVHAAPPLQKKLKATLTGYHYDFQGTRNSKDNSYGFQDVTLNMQLATVTYDIEPTLTLMLMGMNLENYAETYFPAANFLSKDRTSGTGDTVISAIKTYIPSATFLVIADAGVSVPTGSITKKNPADPTGNLNYAYNMQLGSGTYDALVGITPLYFTPSFHFGSRLAATLRSGGLNSEGYRLGNQYKVDAWVDYPTSTGLTPRLVGYYKHKAPIVGQDRTFGRIPLTRFYHEDQINWDVSAAVKYSKAFGAVALNAEAGVPVLQGSKNFDDVKVETQVYGSVGVTGSF
jgi:hypothetical protein